MNKPVLVVLAAGMGSRYHGLKQIDPMGKYGEKILDYSVYDAKRAGFETVVFVIKPQMKQEFEEQVGKRLRRFVQVKYAFQTLDALPQGFTVPQGREKPWGTAHALMRRLRSSMRTITTVPAAISCCSICLAAMQTAVRWWLIRWQAPSPKTDTFPAESAG